MKKGNIIIFDGCPSSGKTTLASLLQEKMDIPFLYLKIDDFLHMLPNKWISFTSEITNPEGFEFAFKQDEEGHPVIELGVGPVGEKLLMGYINAVKGLAEAGNNVICDGILTRKDWVAYFKKSLEGFPVYFIGLYAPLEVLERRERSRWEPPGLARGRYEEVYSLEKDYDLFIDTSQSTPEQSVRIIIDHFKNLSK